MNLLIYVNVYLRDIVLYQLNASLAPIPVFPRLNRPNEPETLSILCEAMGGELSIMTDAIDHRDPFVRTGKSISQITAIPWGNLGHLPRCLKPPLLGLLPRHALPAYYLASCGDERTRGAGRVVALAERWETLLTTRKVHEHAVRNSNVR